MEGRKTDHEPAGNQQIAELKRKTGRKWAVVLSDLKKSRLQTFECSYGFV
jgi:hypothetical protein